MALLRSGARPQNAPALKQYFLRMSKLQLLRPNLRSMRFVALRM